MYNVQLENELIIFDIRDTLASVCSVQYDMDDNKLKSAQKLAIDMDLTEIIGEANVSRCVDQADDASQADQDLLKLIIAPLCHYTYKWSLDYFQGTLTDSGFSVVDKAEAIEEAEKAAVKAEYVGSKYMNKVIAFLEAEDASTLADIDNVPKVSQVFGGTEGRWDSN